MKEKEIKIRIRSVSSLSESFPVTAKLIIKWFESLGKTSNFISFSVDTLPPTANDLYRYGKRSVWLSKEVKTFREWVNIAIGLQKHYKKFNGVVCVLMFVESPYWITKKNTVKKMDLDNRIKSTLDAIKLSIGFPDETNWEIHAWKIPSKKTRTTVYLFDLGDLIDFYS